MWLPRSTGWPAEREAEDRKMLQPPIREKPAFMTPARIMTQMGFILNFRSSRTQTAKIRTRDQRVSVKETEALLPQKAEMRMETPAEAIIATTAGRRELKML